MRGSIEGWLGINNWRGCLLAAALAGFSMVRAHADGLAELDTFLRSTQQGQASFVQVVTMPKKDGDPAARSKTSSGIFEFQRPNKFRFQYQRPFEQLIVADGTTLWLFDVDLNQATARRQQDVLGNTPAALIAAAPDLRGLGNTFTLSNAPDADGMQWVQATPKGKEGQLQTVRLGFKAGQFSVLEIQDNFGQHSVLTFGPLNAQPGFKTGHFTFQPPAGVDLVRQ